MLSCHVHSIWQKQLNPCNVLAVVGSIAIDGALTLCVFLHLGRNSHTSQIIVQRSLIRALMLYEWKLRHIYVDAFKLFVMPKVTANLSKYNKQILQKFGSVCYNLIMKKNQVVVKPRNLISRHRGKSGVFNTERIRLARHFTSRFKWARYLTSSSDVDFRF